MATTKTIAQPVDDLFKEHRKPDGQEYLYQEVSKALEEELDASDSLLLIGYLVA